MNKPFKIEAIIDDKTTVVTIDPNEELVLAPDEFLAVKEFTIAANEVCDDEELVAATIFVFVQLRRALGNPEGLMEAMIDDLRLVDG